MFNEEGAAAIPGGRARYPADYALAAALDADSPDVHLSLHSANRELGDLEGAWLDIQP